MNLRFEKYLTIMTIVSAILILIASFIITTPGCKHISFSPDAQVTAARIAARHIGAKIIKKHPEYLQTALTICNGIIMSQNKEQRKQAFESAVALLLQKVVKDEKIRADIKDLLNMIQINGDRLIIPSVKGFQEGVQINNVN